MEEFFVWRLVNVPLIGLRLKFEKACPTMQSNIDVGALPDLRITNFDVTEIRGTTDAQTFLLGLAYSNSTIKVSSSYNVYLNL